MSAILRSLKYCLVALCLTGCGATGPIFTDAPPPPSGKALVYIFRPHSFVNQSGTARIEMDGKPFVALHDSGYSYAYFSPGSHVLTQAWPLGLTQGTKIDLNLEAGKTYFVAFYNRAGMGTTGLQAEWGLIQGPESEARPQIAVCKFDQPDPAAGTQ